MRTLCCACLSCFLSLSAFSSVFSSLLSLLPLWVASASCIPVQCILLSSLSLSHFSLRSHLHFCLFCTLCHFAIPACRTETRRGHFRSMLLPSHPSRANGPFHPCAAFGPVAAGSPRRPHSADSSHSVASSPSITLHPPPSLPPLLFFHAPLAYQCCASTALCSQRSESTIRRCPAAGALPLDSLTPVHSLRGVASVSFVLVLVLQVCKLAQSVQSLSSPTHRSRARRRRIRNSQATRLPSSCVPSIVLHAASTPPPLSLMSHQHACFGHPRLTPPSLLPVRASSLLVRDRSSARPPAELRGRVVMCACCCPSSRISML